MKELVSNSPIPLYYQLREIIREMILSGEWQYGMEIPSELKLCEEYNLCRATVKQTLDGLVNEGLIMRQKGRGTFVIYQKVEGDFLLEPKFSKQGAPDENFIELIEADLVSAPPFLSRVLKMQDSIVCKINRRHFVDKQPIILETNYIAPEWAGEILSQNLRDVAIYRYIEQGIGKYFTDYKMNVQALILDSYERAQLGFPSNNTGLMLQCVSYVEDVPVMLNKRIYRGDRCDLLLDLSVMNANRKLEATGIAVSIKEKKSFEE